MKKIIASLSRNIRSEEDTEDDTEVKVHPETRRPTALWSKMKVKQTVTKLYPLDPNTPIEDDKLRFVCVSDTHAKIEISQLDIPKGDVLLHGGDITNVGHPNELYTFNHYLGEYLPFHSLSVKSHLRVFLWVHECPMMLGLVARATII